MKPFITSLVIVLCLTTASAEQNDLQMLTQGLHNGRTWENFTGDEQATFLLGVDEGLFLLARHQQMASRTSEVREALNSLTLTSGFTTRDLSSEVTSFYRERANIRVPIIYAYEYALKKTKGASQRELIEFTTSLRKQWNQ